MMPSNIQYTQELYMSYKKNQSWVKKLIEYAIPNLIYSFKGCNNQMSSLTVFNYNPIDH